LRINKVNYLSEHLEDLNELEDSLDLSYNEIENEYWDIIEKQTSFVEVKYGSDLDNKSGTGKKLNYK
jgi:hypothetical protein